MECWEIWLSAQFLFFFFLFCDWFIRSKSAQQKVGSIQLEKEEQMDGDYRRERTDFKLQVEKRSEKVFGQELVSL